MSWTTAALQDRLALYLGRGVGGDFGPDELFTSARQQLLLADAYEQVVSEFAPRFPSVFMGGPVQMISTNGGVTYITPSGDTPFGHAEVYSRENAVWELVASTYGDRCGDFVIEGNALRMPGNRVRTWSGGAPWIRYVGMPTRLDTGAQPVMEPPSSRELILWRALALAAEIPNGDLDSAVWQQKYSDAAARYTMVWATQYSTVGQQARGGVSQPWWAGFYEDS